MAGGMDDGSGFERRRYPRVDVELGARYLLSSGVECEGCVENMSACGCYVRPYPPGRAPDNGERIVIYIDKFGRFEGHAVRASAGGFAVDFAISALKQERIARSLEKVAAGDMAAIEETRRHPRVAGDDAATMLRLANGTTTPVKVIDISLSGASVETNLRPAIGVYVELGRMHARVVRHHENGIAVEFAEAAAANPGFGQRTAADREQA